MIVLPITLTIAAAAVLLNLWLSVRISRLRRAHKISIGDGGSAPLIARMRAQANFIENTPLFLILLGLVELAHGSATWLWLVGIVFIAARILHAFGMDRTGANPLRFVGFLFTMLPMLGLAGYALATPYLMPRDRGSRDERGRSLSYPLGVSLSRRPAEPRPPSSSSQTEPSGPCTTSRMRAPMS